MNQHTTCLIRITEVLNRTGYGKAWMCHLISKGRIPAHVKIGVRAVDFIESEVDEWMQSVMKTS
ncbi:helix-turn-helix transcriptional regulator, partial [Serratia marcescens]|uniref:helix-turn-helix transcriptional regulator n=1 Tax=Serratia marcescens TaxID=615 RepID=UPI0009514DC7